MDEEALEDLDDKFLKVAMEIYKSELFSPSAPATVPTVQFQSTTGNKSQRGSYSSLSRRQRIRERAMAKQRLKLNGDHLKDCDKEFHKTSIDFCNSSLSLSPKERKRKRATDEQVLEDWDEDVMEILQFPEFSDELPPPSAPVTVLAPPPAPKISKISTTISQADQQIQSTARKLKNFPAFLRFYKHIYELVDDPSTDSFISWGKSNKSFVVTNPQELVLRKILSRFSCNTFKQFIKRLKYYGFKEINASANVWEFGNSNFVRGKPELMVEMHNVEVQDRLKNIRV